MEDFDSIELSGDISIPYKVQTFNCQINKDHIPSLKKPFLIQNDSPIIGLSNCFIKNPTSTIQKMTFPFLIDTFNNNFKMIDNEPPKCPKCGAYFVNEACPICEKHDPSHSSYVVFPNKIDDGIYIFVLIGNVEESFYQKITKLKHKFVLCSYTDHLIFLSQSKSKFSLMDCFDSQMPPSIVLSDINDIPVRLPQSNISKVDFNEIIDSINTAIPDTSITRNIVLINELPHKCAESFPLINATLSVMPTNTFRCQCRRICPLTGGFYMPHNIELPEFVTQVNKITLKTAETSIVNEKVHLTAPGFFSVIDGLSIQSSTSKTIQISVERPGYTFLSTFTLNTVDGIHNFFLNANLVPFLIAKKDVQYSRILKEYGRNEGRIEMPSKLMFTYHFEKVFDASSCSVYRVFSRRPFLLQIKPTFRVPAFVSDEIISNMSILVILIDFALYIYVGGDVKRSDWKDIIGCEPDNGMSSFKVNDTGLDNELWRSIRKIKQQFYTIDVPVIAVPSESGRRTEIIEELQLDCVNNDNQLARKFSEIANEISK